MRRNTKTMYEWRKAYRDKEELMLERGFPEVSPHEFYRDLFPEGSLQSAEHDGKGNVIATQIRPSGKGRTKQWVVDDSLNMLDKVIGDELKQEQHLQLARGIRALKEQMGENVVGGGRPDKAKIVEEWRTAHPEGTPKDCIADTGISKNTVYKWWSVGEAL